MFTVSNLKINKFNLRINEYFIDNEGAYLNRNEEYIFIFEGYLYPDINYKESDIIDYFLKSEDKFKDFKKFKGKYSGVFIDLRNNKVLFFNDQLGLKDIFYHTEGKKFIISNSFSAILKHKDFSYKDIDVDAVNEFLVFEYPLSDGTFIKKIKILPLASIYELKNENLIKFNYWKYELVENKDFDEYEAVEKLDLLFYNSIMRIKLLNQNKKFGLGLSGGNDSRLVAYYAKKNNLNLKTFIFGDFNSDAYQISKKIAKKLKIKHYELGVDKNFIKYAFESTNFNPMMSILYTWYYSTNNFLPEFDVLLTGFLGGEIFGSHINKEDIETKDLINTIYNRFNQDNTKLNHNKMINGLFQVIKNLDSEENIDKILEFDFKQRQLKFIKNNPSLNFMGNYNGVSIFEDINLVEYLLEVPYNWKIDLKLYKLFFREKVSKLYGIRAEREYKFDNKLLLIIEKIFRIIDIKILKCGLFYKKSHKNIKKWLKDNKFFYSYCNNILESKNEFFNENFNCLDMNKELQMIFEGKSSQEQLFFRLLTIKMWLDSFKDLI